MEKKDKEKTKDEKKFKKKKSVNWDTKTADDNQNKKENEPEKEKDKDKEYFEIEVINKDGNTFRERVKYEAHESKDFVKKRGEKMHDEYTKAKEFQEKMKNEE